MVVLAQQHAQVRIEMRPGVRGALRVLVHFEFGPPFERGRTRIGEAGAWALADAVAGFDEAAHLRALFGLAQGALWEEARKS